jgi:LAS superfamily LD-carboxypeptidase LdcB
MSRNGKSSPIICDATGWILIALLGAAGCFSLESKDVHLGICGDAVAPRLSSSALPPGEIADDCMLQWVRRGKRFSLGTYAPRQEDLVDVGDGHRLRRTAAVAFRRMQAEAATAGHTLVPVSAYRSRGRQARTHETWVRRRQEKRSGAISREQVVIEVDEFSARAGHSEHQLGTTVDVSVPGQQPFNSGGRPSAFAMSCAGKWVRDHAHRFGFTMSYPHGREAITCFQPEPWHFRYVGVTLATEFFDRGIALEEYFREKHPDIAVRADVTCPHTRESLRYDVPGLQECSAG